MKHLRKWLLAMAVMAAAACAGEPTDPNAPGAEEEPELQIPGFESYIDGKEDTGYIGTRAAELEATFTGHVQVKLPEKSPEDLQALARELQEDPRSWTHRDITVQVTEQIKYARNALKARKLDLNLEGGSPTFTDVLVQDDGLELHYRVTVESLVKFKELEEGVTPADLVGVVIEPTLPLVPGGLFERTANKCTIDPDTGNAVDPHDLGAHNLFYYFKPDAADCPLTEADLVVGRYAIDSSLDAPTVYPEYDRLVADGRVDMVAIFGQITHGELGSNDWGFISFNSFSRAFERDGFRVVERFPENQGHRLERSFPGGLVVSITLYTPVLFADGVDREVSNETFREAMRKHEIIYYNGHAFYGSLRVLDDRAAYPEGKYQIVFMDACWSYAYYTKQIFRNRATDDDPEGYALVDVVNNTEPGITGSERTAQILYQNIFKGASAVRTGSDASIYSWNNLIKYMNDHAEERARYRTQYPDPEIYGASGVRDNRWSPDMDEPEDPTTEGTRYESTETVIVPDNHAEGAKSVIDVDAEGTASAVKITVDISHPYVGDLSVVLTHGDRELALHDKTGGSSDDLALKITTEHFAGLPVGGAWILKIVDHARQDEGKLVGWSVEL